MRVRERRDVDLILGQGSFSAGWHAHALTLPGAFLVSDPEHVRPERARAHLMDDAGERARLGAAAGALYAQSFDIEHTIAALREDCRPGDIG